MPFPAVFLIHSATLRGKRQNFTLGYDNGTAAFTAGKTLTGATSHATAIIVSTGAQASGTLTLYTITGTFQDNEVLSDNGTVPGAALVNGTIAQARDTHAQLTYTDLDTTVACRIFPGGTATRNGNLVITSPHVLLPAGTNVALHDNLISTNAGLVNTYTISAVPKPVYEATQAATSHWSCEIAGVA